MIWSRMVVLATWRSPRIAMMGAIPMGAIPESRRRQTRWTRWRRVGCIGGPGLPDHQGLIRRNFAAVAFCNGQFQTESRSRKARFDKRP